MFPYLNKEGSRDVSTKTLLMTRFNNLLKSHTVLQLSDKAENTARGVPQENLTIRRGHCNRFNHQVERKGQDDVGSQARSKE